MPVDTQTVSEASPGLRSIAFTKMHGIGNDFLVIDALSDPESPLEVPTLQAVAMQWCDRRTGVGADGVLLIRPTATQTADAEMVVVNADGGIAQMCGNGLRCVCKYLCDHRLVTTNPMRILTGAGVLGIEYIQTDDRVESVTVDMGAPIFDPTAIPVRLPDMPEAQDVIQIPLGKYITFPDPTGWMQQCQLDLHMTAVSMGNPHLVVFCGDVQAVPLETIGPCIERLPIFPEQINVHFVQALGPREVRMRTWERGSGITQACGTGACAVCVAGVLTGCTDRTINAHLPGGDLQLRWDESTSHVFMTGPAAESFAGVIDLP